MQSLIDQGRNPDLYSKEALEKCIKMNEVSKGKIDALEVCALCLVNIKRNVSQHFCDRVAIETHLPPAEI